MMRQLTPRELFEMRLRSRRMMFPGLQAKPGIITVVPGSASYTTPGVYSFTIPYFNSFFADCYGAGGGGSGGSGNISAYGNWGGAGGYGRFYLGGWCDVIGYGGSAGSPGYADGAGGSHGSAGANGTGSGGDGNITGGGYGGGSGGGADYFVGKDGYASYGGSGGTGGRAYKTFTIAQLPFGSVVTITVPSGGYAGSNSTGPNWIDISDPTAGASGVVNISWS